MQNTVDQSVMTTKRALVVLGTLIFLVSLTFVIPAKYVGIKQVKRQPLILREGNELASLQGDKDGNGIPDWKDLLNETTSTTTKEALSNVVVDEEVKKRLDDPNNITASFSKNIYIASAYAKKQGNLTPQEQDALVSTVVESEGDKVTYTSYTIKDLHLSKNETPVTKKEYGNRLGALYTKTKRSAGTTNEIEVIRTFSTNNDASVLSALVIKKNAVATSIQELLQMSVPYSAAPYHLLLVNSLSQYEALLDNLSQASSDPIRATIALNAYDTSILALNQAFESIRTYCTVSGITFSKSDPGFVLTSGYTTQ